MTRAEMKDLAKERLGRKIFGNTWMMALVVCLIYGAIIAAAGGIGVAIGAIILSGPMTYGLNYVFLKLARDGQTPEIGDLFKGFSDDFSGTFLIGLMTGIFTFLWSLLFVIPGIVKSYAYSMACYIKIDHPDYDWRRCIDESRAMMNGHKWELFVLDLSFLGWLIVGSLCLGIGTLWVEPYQQEARAIFYDSLCGKDAPQVGGGDFDEDYRRGNGWYEK